MVDSIAKTLGAGSGIDISALVTGLVDAQYSVKTKQIDTRGETLKTQISTISGLKSGISGFASALANLVKGGSLATQATSSNTGIVKASVLAGQQVGTLSRTIEVGALAAAQVTASTPLDPAAPLGAGSLKIQFGSYATGSFVADATDIPAIEIDAADSTPAAIAAKINAATPPTGLTASIIADGGGQRLVLKSESGAARAFVVTTPTGSSAFADALGIAADDPRIATDAADAELKVDGVPVRRTTNTIDDLVPGVRLDLQSAVPGTRVQLGATPATDALKQAVNDVVTTFNEVYKLVQAATDPITGSLSRDPAAQEMKRKLRALTLTPLTRATDGSAKTLAEIGVATNRDGTLSVDAGRLTKALAADPAAVEAMFTARGVAASGDGLSAALDALSSSVTSYAFGLGASEQRYTKAQTGLTTEKTKLSEAQEKTRTRLTQQYASMDSRVAAYKATQSMLQNQIDAWNAN